MSMKEDNRSINSKPSVAFYIVVVFNSVFVPLG